MGITLHYFINHYDRIVILGVKSEEDFYNFLENKVNHSLDKGSKSFFLDISTNYKKIMNKRMYNLGKLKIIRSQATSIRFGRVPLRAFKEKEVFLNSFPPACFFEYSDDDVEGKLGALAFAKDLSREFKGTVYIAVNIIELLKNIAYLGLRVSEENELIELICDSQKIERGSGQDFRTLWRYK